MKAQLIVLILLTLVAGYCLFAINGNVLVKRKSKNENLHPNPCTLMRQRAFNAKIFVTPYIPPVKGEPVLISPN